MKKKNHYISKYFLAFILFSIDLFVLWACADTAVYIRSAFFETLPKLQMGIFDFSWIVSIILFLFTYEKIYSKRDDFWSETFKIYKALFYAFFVVLSVITLSKASDSYSRLVIFIFFAFAFVMIPLIKRMAKYVLFKWKYFKLDVKVLADTHKLEVLKTEFENNWYYGYRLNNDHFDMVLIDSKKYDAIQLQHILGKYGHFTKDIYVIPYLENIDFSHADMISYGNIRLSSFHIENRLLKPSNIIMKFIFEKFVGLVLLPFILLVHLLIVAMIRIDSPGRALFKQKRLGKNSKQFDCYKYRTMYEKSDAILQGYLKDHPEEVAYFDIYHKYKNDPRVTRVGMFLRATSLDELPQFYNLFKCEMNLIGPRPYMHEESAKIGEHSQELILRVSPGITGLWQVSGRNDLSFSDRVKMDTWYIQNWSPWMDFVIFFKTIKAVLVRKGAK